MLWVICFGVALTGSMGHEFPRTSRIRFPYEGPPPPMLGDLYTGPRIFPAESQSHPVFHESSSSFDYKHTPFNTNSQKSHNAGHFPDSGRYETGKGKPFINQHRSPPSRPRDGQFHETQPPPFATPSIPQGTKVKGILNAPPPPPTPSLSSLIEGESERHRFAGHRDPNHSERRPSNGQRHQSNDGHPPNHYEKHPVNDRHPVNNRHSGHAGLVRDEKPFDPSAERQRPSHDRPPKGGEQYLNRERYPSHSEKPLVYNKEKGKIPFVSNKKPLFSPTFTHEKPIQNSPPRAPAPPQVDDYSSAPSSDEDSDYFRNKLKEEYYSSMQNTQFADYPVQTRMQNPKKTQPNTVKSRPGFEFNDTPFNFDIPNYGATADPGSPFPAGSSVFPQSEEFGDFFDTSLPEWMNEFKGPPSDTSHHGGSGAPKQQKLTTQETKRQPYKHSEEPSYFDHHSYEEKYVNKRNPVQSQKNKNNFDDGEDYEKNYYQKNQGSSYGDSRTQSDPYYDGQESSEFDFGSSPEFNMQDFNKGSFNFGSGTTKPAGTEWIPINAPNGAIPAKSYDIPAPDLSREFFQSQSQYDSDEYNSHPTRRPSSRAEKSREHSTSNVVYGAREKKRQNEGVVSASVMVKQ
ncbi:hypothetical protein GE061_016875 [Apolygus lucorum]|uniref:Uncharacterized protein n=1 Tax=Apolygus lucorum TaxID=248454 RepID=A0A8S9XIJ1_APOLU|nr:hypothetical protein GE061_016875 [Apolygus lucorum]